MRALVVKNTYAFLALCILASFAPAKITTLDWTLISETTWEQKSDETNNANLWIPTFSKKLKAFGGVQVHVTGYISIDAQGNYILTQFKRNPKSKKDFSQEPPDFIELSAWDASTYFAELKKYTVSGTLILNEYVDSGAAFSLSSPRLEEK